MGKPYYQGSSNPFKALAPAPTKAAPKGGGSAPADPDALYHRLLTAAATSRDKAGFLQAHRQELNQLKPQVRQVVVQAAGLGAPAATVAKALSPGSYGNRQLRLAAQDVKGIPGGIVHAATQSPIKTAKELAHGVVETVKHPGRDLFQTGTLVVGAVSGGAGLAGRVGAVADVGKLATDLPSAVAKLSKADKRAYAVLANPVKHLPTVDKATADRILTTSPALGRVLDIDPHLAAERSAFIKRVGDKTITPRTLMPLEKPAAAARAVGATKAAQVTRAAVKTPLPQQRTLTVPGEGGGPAITVHPVPSKNLAANLVERKLIDPLRQKRLDAGAAQSRLAAVTKTLPGGETLAEGAAKVASAQTKVGRELRAHRAVIDSLELAPVSRLDRFAPSAPARGLTTATRGRVNVATVLPRKLGGERKTAAEQKAIDILAADSTPAQQVAYHTQLIARGTGDVAAHKLQIALTKAAAPHFERLAAGNHPGLEQALTETRALIRKGETLKGLTPEEIAHRVGARVADIKAVAAGKLSPLEEITRIQDTIAGSKPPKGSVAAEHAQITKALTDNKAAQHAYENPGTRLVTSKQAQARLAELDATYAKVLEPYTQKVMSALPYNNPAAETARRNVLRAQYDRQQAGVTRAGRPSGASAGKVKTRPITLREEARQLAEQNISKMIARNPSHPTVQRVKAMIEERAHLKAALEQEHPVFGEGKPVEKRISVGPQHPDATLTKLRRQESRMRTRLDELGAHQKLADIHQSLVDEGFKAVENGAFYLPSYEKTTAVFRRKTPATRQPSEYGLGPMGDHPAMKHPFTGARQRSGRQRSDATRLASESYKQAQRYATLERGHKQLLAAARATKAEAGGEQFAIPIRTTVSIPAGLKRLIQQADVGTLTRAELKGLNQGDVEAYAKALFPEEKQLADLKGIKWIDSRYLGGMRGQGNPFAGAPGSMLDAVNAPFRAALLYTKPSYALNLLQALGTNVIQQGVFTPVNLRAALRLGKELGAEDQHAIFSLVGQGRSRSYESTGAASRTINAAGEFWNTITDRYPRASSWLHEARREGFNTPETIHQLINDPRMQDKLVEVTRRANKEAIEYGQLSPFEQNVLRRALFFYPWMRGATLYSLRYGKEHPVQAAVAAQLGAQGHDQSVKAFGPFVDYGPGTAGLVPIGKDRGSNLTNLNTFSTPVEAVQAAMDPSRIPQMLGPAAGAIYTGISGKTPLGIQLPATKNRYVAAGQQLTDLIPFVQAFNRAKTRPTADKVVKQPIFPKGPQAAGERYLGGAVFPQPVNKPALAAKGETAYRAKLGATEKVRYDTAKMLQQAQANAADLHRRGVFPAPTLPPTVRQALTLDRARKLGAVQAAKDVGVPVGNLSAVDKAGVVAKVVRDAKTAPPGIIANYERLIAMQTDPAVQSNITKRFWAVYGKGGQLSAWRTFVSHHKAAQR